MGPAISRGARSEGSTAIWPDLLGAPFLLRVAECRKEESKMIAASDREWFIESGYDPIPLKYRTKEPQASNWQKKPLFLQWENAESWANIGLRAGNGVAFIDCDNKTDPNTFDNITRWLAGLGYDSWNMPIVQTASGVGRHIYINLKGPLLGHYRRFINDIGTGELRYGYASFVATFPSLVDDGQYKLIQGDIANRPTLETKDLLGTLIPMKDDTTTEKKHPTMSGLALAIAKGEKLAKYKTDSEAEFALVLSLIDSRFNYQEIKSIFDSYPCQGHYKDKHVGKDRERWLYMTYQNALAYSEKESPVRQKIKTYLDLARNMSWSNVNDKNIYLAHLDNAFKAGKYEYGLSVRAVSLYAGVTLDTVTKGTERVLQTGLIEKIRPGKGITATVYRLNMDKIGQFLTEEVLRDCTDLSMLKGYTKVDNLSQHDAFVNGKHRLGRRAGDIYELLFVEPLTVKEIAKKTGAHKKTIKRAIDKLRRVVDRKTGEIIELVTLEGDKWHSNIVDLELVSAIQNTYGYHGKKEEEYNQDRKEYAKNMELYAIRGKKNELGDVQERPKDRRICAGARTD
jgi:transposase